MKAQASASFRKRFEKLSAELQKTAIKQFKLWKLDHHHPSLEFKPVGTFWSARVNDACRALGEMVDEDTIRWFWIGMHDEYERLIGRG